MRRKLFTAMSVFLLMSVSCPVLKVQADVDNVFVDENDGDFDAYAIIPEHLATPNEPKEKPKAAPAPETVAHEAPKTAPPKPVETVEKVKKPKKSKPVAEKKTPTKSTGPGLYVRTKEACPMLRKPASDSPAMLTVKASKRIWVQEVDENWVKAYNKSGEPGYIQRDCLE